MDMQNGNTQKKYYMMQTENNTQQKRKRDTNNEWQEKERRKKKKLVETAVLALPIKFLCDCVCVKSTLRAFCLDICSMLYVHCV